MQEPNNKQQFQRELINEHLPYELLAFCTVRYYGELQAAGALDIIDLLMFIEGLSEQEALDKCLQILKQTSERRSKIVQYSADLMRQDMSGLFDHFKNN